MLYLSVPEDSKRDIGWKASDGFLATIAQATSPTTAPKEQQESSTHHFSSLGT